MEMMCRAELNVKRRAVVANQRGYLSVGSPAAIILAKKEE
jgi:hypothetical protein